MKGLISQLPLIKEKSGWPWTIETDPKIYDPNFNWPKISIVTPSFNQGEYIEETIRSVILQNYPNIEYVIIDGGSSDITIQIINKYEKWITFWVSEQDDGQADAINKGIGYLSGHIFNWINSDDLLSEKSLYYIAINYDQYDIIAGKTMIFSDRGSYIDENKNLIKIPDFVKTDIGYLQPSCWVKLDNLRKVGNLRPDMHYIFDYEMMIRIINKNSKIKYLNNIIAHFRLHDESKTVSKTINFFIEMNKVYCEYIKLYFDKNDLENLTKILLASSNESMQQYLSYTTQLSKQLKYGSSFGVKPFWLAFFRITVLYLKKLRFIISGTLQVVLTNTLRHKT